MKNWSVGVLEWWSDGSKPQYSNTPITWGVRMRLGGKVAIVTGGARHIGAAYCRRLAAEGAAVVIADVLDGEDVVKEIAAAGRKAIALEVDVSREEDTERMAAEAVQA